jgi:hypothetical protein
MKIMAAILSIPTFCWQTMSEVLSYAEQLNDAVEYQSVGAYLNHLIKRGQIDTKLVRQHPHKKGPRMIRMYRRHENPPHG